jgi:hypothetical protein
MKTPAIGYLLAGASLFPGFTVFAAPATDLPAWWSSKGCYTYANIHARAGILFLTRMLQLG